MLKRFGLCAAALLFVTLGAVTPAHAALVTFTTSGAFSNCGGTAVCGGTSMTIGTGTSKITITFTGLGDTVLTPGLTTFGKFNTSGGNGTLVGNPPDTADFTLTITQTLPGPGSVSFTSTFQGQLRVNQSSAYILFTTLVGSIPGAPTIKYFILEADNHTAGRSNLNAPKTGGATSLDATVEGKIVPEPASTLLLGLGFLGSAAAARRRMTR